MESRQELQNKKEAGKKDSRTREDDRTMTGKKNTHPDTNRREAGEAKAPEGAGRGDNLILIGMPTSGKSTVGIILAKALGYEFTDIDLLIQKKAGKKLAAIMEEEGVDGFLSLEEEITCGLSCSHTVIAPGGSVVYGKKAMEHLKSLGRVIYLQMDLDMLTERLHDARNRGVALREGQTLEELYNERVPLYEQYADITVNESGHALEDMVVLIVSKLHAPA